MFKIQKNNETENQLNNDVVHTFKLQVRITNFCLKQQGVHSKFEVQTVTGGITSSYAKAK